MADGKNVVHRLPIVRCIAALRAAMDERPNFRQSAAHADTPDFTFAPQIMRAMVMRVRGTVIRAQGIDAKQLVSEYRTVMGLSTFGAAFHRVNPQLRFL